MTRMRWDGLHKLDNGWACAYDELPRTGSKEDQKRFFRQLSEESTGATVSRLTAQRIKGLRVFLTYVESLQFARRDDLEKRKVVNALRVATQEILGGPDCEYVAADFWVQRALAACRRYDEAKRRWIVKSLQGEQ